MAANILTVCDALVESLIAGLDAPTQANVERVYLSPVDMSDDDERHVWVFPASYEDNPASRGEDEWVYQVGVIVAERYTDTAEPTVAWVDERVEFAQAKVFDALDFARTLLTFETTRRLWTQTSSCPVVYDDDRLQRKLFWTEMRFEFREILTA